MLKWIVGIAVISVVLTFLTNIWYTIPLIGQALVGIVISLVLFSFIYK